MKLVRDRIPLIAPSHRYRRASREEMAALLADKVVEEALELRESPRLEELADVYEALRALAGALGYTWEQVEEAARRKRAERGGFTEGWVMLDE